MIDEKTGQVIKDEETTIIKGKKIRWYLSKRFQKGFAFILLLVLFFCLGRYGLRSLEMSGVVTGCDYAGLQFSEDINVTFIPVDGSQPFRLIDANGIFWDFRDSAMIVEKAYVPVVMSCIDKQTLQDTLQRQREEYNATKKEEN